MGRGAGPHALVAARAALEVDDEQILGLHEALAQEVVELDRAHRLPLLGVGLQPGLGHLGQPRLDVGELAQHQVEVLGLDAHRLHVVQRGAGAGAYALAAEQADLAEVVGPGEVAQHHVAARERLADLHEADADEVEAVGLLALAADDLARLEAYELDPVA